jgi:ubiquinone biosynthesis protein
MVMERIHGVLVSDMAELLRRGTNIQALAENGVEIFFTQVFRHNFFHADMHPGNIFVQTRRPERPRTPPWISASSARSTHATSTTCAENFLAFFDGDYNRVARLHVDSGWVPPDTRIDELEAAVRTVCEPIFNKPLAEISFAQVLMRLFETARRFDMQVQPQLILLQKTLLQIEGLGPAALSGARSLEDGNPCRQWMREPHDPRTRFKQLSHPGPRSATDIAMLRCCIAALRASTPKTAGRAPLRSRAGRRERRGARLEQLVGGAAP